MLSVEHVTKTYGKFTALEDISLTFTPGVYGLLAPNGDATRAFKILRNDPIIADQRIGLHHDLSSIAGIRQCLQIAAHAGGEHQLAHGVRRPPEPEALKHLAIL